MRNEAFSLILGFAFLVPAALPAAAQQVPDVVGNWKGMLTAVHIGSNPYRVAQGPSVQFPLRKHRRNSLAGVRMG